MLYPRGIDPCLNWVLFLLPLLNPSTFNAGVSFLIQQASGSLQGFEGQISHLLLSAGEHLE
jgi:hypothetical protein